MRDAGVFAPGSPVKTSGLTRSTLPHAGETHRPGTRVKVRGHLACSLRPRRAKKRVCVCPETLSRTLVSPRG